MFKSAAVWQEKCCIPLKTGVDTAPHEPPRGRRNQNQTTHITPDLRSETRGLADRKRTGPDQHVEREEERDRSWERRRRRRRRRRSGSSSSRRRISREGRREGRQNVRTEGSRTAVPAKAPR